MRVLPIAALAFAFAACGSEAPATENEEPDRLEISLNAEIPGEQVATLLTEGGEVQLGLTDEVLYMGLTDRVAGEVEKELDDAKSEGGLGGLIAGAVSSVVAEALRTPIQIPLDDVQDIRYEDERLEIDLTGENTNMDLEINDEPLEQQFDSDEARRFVDAFHNLTGR